MDVEYDVPQAASVTGPTGRRQAGKGMDIAASRALLEEFGEHAVLDACGNDPSDRVQERQSSTMVVKGRCTPRRAILLKRC